MVTIHIGKGKDDLWRRHICSINEAPTVPPSLLFDYRRKGLNNYQIQKSNMNLILNLSIKKKKLKGLIERFFDRYPAYKQHPVFKENLTCA